MKLLFEPDLDYQLQAIESVCDLFRGQEICQTEFTVTQHAKEGQQPLALAESDLGIGNRLSLLPDEIGTNLERVQLRNGVPPSRLLVSRDFTVEMETGTGKTYVYLRTILELNKRFGFTKFVIVVPSVAIKEGVFKSLQITDEHFKSLYSGVPFEYFLYDSTKLGEVRNFATSPNIQIMVMTVGAINKRDVNNIYEENEKTGGEKPIDLIRATQPIVIVDEPQSVDGGLQGRGKEALDAMNPVCTLRYSATHADKHHMVYRLDAVDSYEQKLVKQIEVASATVSDAHNRPYVRLESVEKRRDVISARVKLDTQGANGVRRRIVTVQDGDDLEQTTGRAMYSECRIGEIRVQSGNQYMELRTPGGEAFLKPGEAWGDIDPLSIQREMIRRTIREHLDKEKRLRPQGIKVLSLFFIDQVAKYRSYDDDGVPEKGEYATIFEEEYQRLAQHPDYSTLFQDVDLSSNAQDVHDGYFSIDRKGTWTDTTENSQPNRDSAERAYNLIMRDKERLLSLDTPLKFIFSHSALREGWDSPNVFQICNLREIRTERERRQTIGRGLRLCVNQEGERLRGFEVNTLTVIATESFEEFAENLQKEIESDTGIRFGIVEPDQFAVVMTIDEDGDPIALGLERSKAIWDHLKAEGLIDSRGRVQDSLRDALKTDSLAVPEEFEAQQVQISDILKKLAGRLEVKNADERRTIQPRQAVLQSETFKALWDRVKHKTTYRVRFDNEKLIEACTVALRDAPPIPKTRLLWQKADIAIGKSGVEATERGGASIVSLDQTEVELPDLLTELQDRTQLTRRTIHRVLVDSGRLDDFERNPQRFIDLAEDALNSCKRLAVVDGIKYQSLGDDHFYAQELFEQEELTGYLRNLLDVDKGVYEQVVYDSEVEAGFARRLEMDATVKVYAKLPGWFRIPTPLGTYNPDWAVLVEQEGVERLYLVVETKGTLSPDMLRDTEAAKVECGKVHFKAIGKTPDAASYVVARTWDGVMSVVL